MLIVCVEQQQAQRKYPLNIICENVIFCNVNSADTPDDTLCGM